MQYQIFTTMYRQAYLPYQFQYQQYNIVFLVIDQLNNRIYHRMECKLQISRSPCAQDAIATTNVFGICVIWKGDMNTNIDQAH